MVKFLSRKFSHLKWLFKPAVWFIIPSGSRATLQFRFQHRKILAILFVFFCFLGYFFIEGMQQEVHLLRLKFSISNYEKLLPLYQKEVDDYGEISFLFRTELKELNAIVNFFEQKNNYTGRYANVGFLSSGAQGGRDISIENVPKKLIETFHKRGDELVTYNVEDISTLLGDVIEHGANINGFIQRRNKFARSLPTLFPIRVSMGYIKDSSRLAVIIKSLYGFEVLAAGDGKVLSVGMDSNNLVTIFIDHGYGYVTEYHRLISSNLKKGDDVVKGKKIGLTSDKLIYKVKLADEYQNPLDYLLVSY